MLFAIKNINTGEIDTETISSSIEESWDRCLGFQAKDDQWAWRRQKAEGRGYYAVEVELVQKNNKEIDDHIKLMVDLHNSI